MQGSTPNICISITFLQNDWQSVEMKICNLFLALEIAGLHWSMAATNRNGLIRLEGSPHWKNTVASTIQCICFGLVDQLLFLRHCGLTKIEKHFILKRSTEYVWLWRADTDKLPVRQQHIKGQGQGQFFEEEERKISLHNIFVCVDNFRFTHV